MRRYSAYDNLQRLITREAKDHWHYTQDYPEEAELAAIETLHDALRQLRGEAMRRLEHKRTAPDRAERAYFAGTEFEIA